MCTFFGPLHLLFLAESFAHHFVHCRLHEACRDRLTMAIPLAIVRDQMRIVLDVRAKLFDGFNQLLKLGIRLLEVVDQRLDSAPSAQSASRSAALSASYRRASAVAR